jgi:hypothetical protein
MRMLVGGADCRRDTYPGASAKSPDAFVTAGSVARTIDLLQAENPIGRSDLNGSDGTRTRDLRRDRPAF